MKDKIETHLPLTEATAYILLALAEPLHGYAVMQKVELISEGTVRVGPGTLYGAFSVMEEAGLIAKAGETNRRKTYALTERGRRLLKEHIRRTAILLDVGRITETW